MELSKTIKMQSFHGNIEVPSVGFGTWAFGDTGWCYGATLQALRAGYRHFDCAWNYGTDDQVGAAIRDSGVPRGELFITTKFWPHWGSPENVGKCLDACLKSMGLEYIDLYLAHWPLVLQPLPDLSKAKASHDATDAERGIATDSHGHIIKDWQYTCKTIAAAHHETGSFHPTWRAMQDLVTTGKVRAIGVSNFNIQQLQEILSLEGSIPLSCNQVESHPRFANSKLFDFMDRNGILKVAYCPFAGQDHDGSPLVEDPKVKELAAKNSMGIGQLLQSWAVQRDTIPIGKSQTLERIVSNLAIRRLPEQDFEDLSIMNKGDEGRTVDLSPTWGVSFF